MENEELYKLGIGNAENVEFDFSSIPAIKYKEFFHALPHFLFRNCQIVKFSNSLFQNFQGITRDDEKTRNIIKNSIFIKKSTTYVTFLFKGISKVLPLVNNLHSISLSNMIIPSKIFLDFGTVLKNTSIDELLLNDVQFGGDEIFSKFASLLIPFQFTNLAFVKCRLTSDSFPTVMNFFKTRFDNPSLVWKLISFNLEENDFTDDEIEEITSNLYTCNSPSKFPVQSSLLSDNESSSNSFVEPDLNEISDSSSVSDQVVHSHIYPITPSRRTSLENLVFFDTFKKPKLSQSSIY